MSKRYPGNFITGNPVALSQSSNNGIFDVNDVYAATNNGTWQEPDGIYEIPRSLRFRSAYLSRTPSTAGSLTTWTFSTWIKRSVLSNTTQTIFYVGNGSNNETNLYLTSDRVQLEYYVAPTNYYVRTTRVLRDTSAWYHLVFVLDTTNASGNERMRIYVNGTRETDFNAINTPPQNQAFRINEASQHLLGQRAGSQYSFDGYMAEVNFVDGQALDPSYFGYTDTTTGIWQPKKYTNGYGTNGFYLPFNQYGSTLMLGKNSGSPSNLITYSEQFDNAAWGKPASPVAPTVTANSTTAPNGTTTADTLNYSGATTHPVLQEATVPTFTLGDTYTFSVYLKKSTAGTFNVQLVWFYTAGGNQDGYTYVTFDSNGVVTSCTPSSSYIQSSAQHVGDGWYRVTCTSTYQGGGAGTVIRGSVGQGSGASSVYAWGAQLNLGNAADTYLQTVASALNQTWTPSGISVTAGTTYDSMADSPTNIFTTATDIGGVVPGNYCILNSVNKSTGGGTLSEGNLRFTTSGGNHTVCGTMALPSSGKWYWEATDTVTGGNSVAGIMQQNQSLETNVVSANINLKYSNMADGSTFGFAVDMDALTYALYKSNVISSGGSPATGSLVSGVTYVPFCMTSASGGASTTFNFGQRPFVYAPPAGYKSLNTTNLQAIGTAAVGKPAIQPNKWFDISLYGGTGSARTITNSGGFVPDLVWTKVRNTTYSHNITDSARGAGLRSYSDGTAAEGQIPNGGVTAFNTASNNGYNINGGVEVNESGRPYVAWQWKQSATSGFAIVTYTGDGTTNRAISHNLGAAPAFQIVKARSGGNAATSNWLVHHQSQATGYTSYLNSTAVQDSGTSQWGSSAATSSNFYVGYTGGAPAANENGTLYVAYLWAEIPGFSKFSTYVGNSSSDGPFVYTGFRPKFILTKALGTANSSTVSTVWNIWDTTRSANNPTLNELYPNRTDADSIDSSGVDILSNGFKPKRNSEYANWSGTTYMYAAFAESPFALNNRAR